MYKPIAIIKCVNKPQGRVLLLQSEADPTYFAYAEFNRGKYAEFEEGDEKRIFGWNGKELFGAEKRSVMSMLDRGF